MSWASYAVPPLVSRRGALMPLTMAIWVTPLTVKVSAKHWWTVLQDSTSTASLAPRKPHVGLRMKGMARRATVRELVLYMLTKVSLGVAWATPPLVSTTVYCPSSGTQLRSSAPLRAIRS